MLKSYSSQSLMNSWQIAGTHMHISKGSWPMRQPQTRGLYVQCSMVDQKMSCKIEKGHASFTRNKFCRYTHPNMCKRDFRMGTNAYASRGGVHQLKRTQQHSIGSYEHGGPHERLLTVISLQWISSSTSGMFDIHDGEPTLSG